MSASSEDSHAQSARRRRERRQGWMLATSLQQLGGDFFCGRGLAGRCRRRSSRGQPGVPPVDSSTRSQSDRVVAVPPKGRQLPERRPRRSSAPNQARDRAGWVEESRACNKKRRLKKRRLRRSEDSGVCALRGIRKRESVGTTVVVAREVQYHSESGSGRRLLSLSQ